MLGATLGVSDYLNCVIDAIRSVDPREVENLSALIESRWTSGRFVFIAGNGGSGANASHLCEDLAKCTLRDLAGQRRLRVLSLTDNTPWITAVANDIGYHDVFAEQLRNLASPGDLLIAISGSGNSPNILNAVEWATAHDVEVVGLTGFGGGKLKQQAGHNVHVPIDDMGIVESVHMTVFHWVIDDLYRRFGAATEAALLPSGR